MVKKLLFIFSLGVLAVLFYNILMFSQNQNLISGYVLSSSTLYPNFDNYLSATATKTDRQIEEVVAKYISKTSATLGVGIKNTATDQEYYLNKDLPFPTASLYKIIVMYAVFYEGKLGKIDLNNSAVQSNLKAMITVSSNEAAISLAEQIGWEHLGEIAKGIGMKNTSLSDPITTTPTDVTNLLNLIAQGRAIDPQASQAMKNLLLGQRLNDRIPRLLPNIPIAHKTGELDDVRHDAGIVFGPKSTYIITLMSKGITSEIEINNLMASLSLDIYNLFEN